MATKTRRTGEVLRLAYASNDCLVKLNSSARAALASCSTGELELHTADILPLRSFVSSIEAVRSTYAAVGPAIATLGVNLIPNYADRKYLPPRAWRVLSRKAAPKQKGLLALADLASGAGLAAQRLADMLRRFVHKFTTSSEYFDIHEQPRELSDLYTLMREMHLGAEEILEELVTEPLQFFQTQLNKLDRPVSSVCEMPLECTSSLKVDTAPGLPSSSPARTTRQVRKTRNRRAARKTEVAAVDSNDVQFKETVRVHEQEMARCGLDLMPAPPAPSTARRRRCRGARTAQTLARDSSTGCAKMPEVGLPELVAPKVESAAVAAEMPTTEMPTAEEEPALHDCTGQSRRRRRRGGKKQTAAGESTDGGAGKSADSEAEVKVAGASIGGNAEVAGDAAVDGGSDAARRRRRRAGKASRSAEGTQGNAALPSATCPSPTADIPDVGDRSEGDATRDPASSSSSDAEGSSGKVAQKRRRTSRLRRQLRRAKKGEESEGGDVEDKAVAA